MKQKILHLFNQEIKKKDQRGIDHLLLSALLRSRHGVSLFKGEIDSVELSDLIQIGVWVGKKGRWGVSSLEQVSDTRLNQAIEQAIEASGFSDEDEDCSLAQPSKPVNSYKPDASISKMTTPQLKDAGLQMESRAQAYSPLIQNIPHISCDYDVITRVLVNSEGVNLCEENSFLSASLSVSASGPDKRVVNYTGSRHFLDHSQFNVDSLVDEVAGEAVARVEPRNARTGKSAILLDPQSAAHLLSMFWSVFSGDHLYRKLTRLDGKLDAKIASECVTLKDNGEGGLIPHAFDAEGSPCHQKLMIDQGVFRSFLHNRYTAKKANTQTTGNAEGGLGSVPGVSPGNISWEKTKSNGADLLTQLNKGILIKELHGASASPISGDFSLGALGYWVEGGKIQYPIADFTIAGNFFDLLLGIEGVGDDLRFFSPHLLGSYGGRSLLVNSLAVSGQ